MVVHRSIKKEQHTKVRFAQKGEGELKVVSPKFKEIIPVSFKKSTDRWLLGAEIPLRGEVVFVDWT